MQKRLLFLNFFLFLSWIIHAQEIKIDRIEVLDGPNSFQNATKKILISPVKGKIELNYNQNSFIVHLKTNVATQLRYQLKLFNQTWFVTSDKRIIFTNLPTGEYLLNIEDNNNSKIKPAQLKIIIESPIWLRWWFLPLMFLYLLILVSIFLYFLFQYRLRQQLRTQIVRDTIARDLHDDIGSYLSSISILSQNVDNLILNNPEKARQSLTKIGETARQVMDTMGDIVWSINPTHDSMEQIVNRMKDFANELFFNQDIEINFQASDSLKKVNLTLERRRDFFLIYKESMTNIYKYAEANLVNVSMQYLDNQVFLKVEDNGKGFEMEQLPKNRASGGNGLKNMKARAEKLNGKLEISSKKNQGTSIMLTYEP